MSAPMMDSKPAPVRIGDRERDECLDVLAQHHVDGRLDAEELGRRQQGALAATTYDELQALLLDLPRLGTDCVGLPRPHRSDSIEQSPVRLPDLRAITMRVARHGVAAAGVGVTAWFGTKGIDDAAVRQVAWNASWITGASGYLGALFASRWR